MEVDCTTTSSLLSLFFLGNMRKIATPSDFYMVLVCFSIFMLYDYLDELSTLLYFCATVRETFRFRSRL